MTHCETCTAYRNALRTLGVPSEDSWLEIPCPHSSSPTIENRPREFYEEIGRASKVPGCAVCETTDPAADLGYPLAECECGASLDVCRACANKPNEEAFEEAGDKWEHVCDATGEVADEQRRKHEVATLRERLARAEVGMAAAREALSEMYTATIHDARPTVEMSRAWNRTNTVLADTDGAAALERVRELERVAAAASALEQQIEHPATKDGCLMCLLRDALAALRSSSQREKGET